MMIIRSRRRTSTNRIGRVRVKNICVNIAVVDCFRKHFFSFFFFVYVFVVRDLISPFTCANSILRTQKQITFSFSISINVCVHSTWLFRFQIYANETKNIAILASILNSISPLMSCHCHSIANIMNKIKKFIDVYITTKSGSESILTAIKSQKKKTKCVWRLFLLFDKI